MITFVTGRYNDETWAECYNYRISKKIPCVYGSPHEMSSKIYYNSLVFVIEMNNSRNRIEGIGLIKNKHLLDKCVRLHSDANYNRYIYFGKFHVDRESLENYNSDLVNILDDILFKGKTHSKRGAGLMAIPEKVLQLDRCVNVDIKKSIKDAFVCHFRHKFVPEMDNNTSTISNSTISNNTISNNIRAI